MCGNELMATLVVVSHPICTPTTPTFVENHNLTLKCVIVSRGGPKPEVYWRHTKRDGVKVSSSSSSAASRRRGDGNDDDDDDNDGAAMTRNDAVGEQNGVPGAGGGGGDSGGDGITANLGELWFAGNTSYNTFSFQVICSRIKR